MSLRLNSGFISECTHYQKWATLSKRRENARLIEVSAYRLQRGSLWTIVLSEKY